MAIFRVKCEQVNILIIRHTKPSPAHPSSYKQVTGIQITEQENKYFIRQPEKIEKK